MSQKIKLIFLVIFVLIHHQFLAQYEKSDSTFKECFVGSSFFMLGNLDREYPPDFFQINIGYRITHQDVVSLEFKTWKYQWSLGIPYHKNKEIFPGYIREKGIAFVYQHFWWKGFYSSIHIMSAWQSFFDSESMKLKNGYQIFNTYRIGYHIKLFNDRLFIEPSIAITHRPYHTKMPKSFKKLDDKYPKLFFGEPGLHFGINF